MVSNGISYDSLKTNHFSHSPKSDVIDDATVIRAVAQLFAIEINTIMPSNWTSRSIVQLSCIWPPNAASEFLQTESKAENKP